MDGRDLAALELRLMRQAWRTLERRWDLSPAERRALLPMGGEDDEGPPQDTEARMRLMIEIGYRVSMPEDLVRDWLRTPVPALGWLAPIDAMAGTRADLRGIRDLVGRGFAS